MEFKSTMRCFYNEVRLARIPNQTKYAKGYWKIGWPKLYFIYGEWYNQVEGFEKKSGNMSNFNLSRCWNIKEKPIAKQCFGAKGPLEGEKETVI